MADREVKEILPRQIDSGASVATDALFADGSGASEYRGITIPDIPALVEVFNATAEPTGFESPELVTMSYDASARTITITQLDGVVIWWRGTRVVLPSPYTSAAHAALDGDWFLSMKSPTSITWTQTVWRFASEAMIAYTRRTGGNPAIFALKEAHGLMPWQAHEELHDTIGTYVKSGLTLEAATYTIKPASPTNADNTPGVNAGVIKDEDNVVNIDALFQGSYTRARPASSTAYTFETAQSLPFRVGTTYPLATSGSGTDTEMATGNYFNVYCVLIPVTADASSQVYRIIWIQPQFIYSSLAEAQGEVFNSLSFGGIQALTPEFVPYGRLTYRTSASYTGATGRCRIESLIYLTGGRSALTAVVATAVTATDLANVLLEAKKRAWFS